MEPIWRRLLFLVAATFLLGACSGSSPHLFRTIYTSVSEPSQELPQFTAVGYADDQPIGHYDSNTKKLLPQASWLKKLAEEDPQYWDRYSQTVQHDEAGFRDDLVILRTRYNQSEGFHTYQMMVGCEVSQDGSQGQYFQIGYDGRDYVSLDMETLTWTAADTQAQITKRNGEVDPYAAHRFKAYVEETCTEWLKGELVYGEERLWRKELPVMRVTRKVDYDGMETLICRAYGFYPKEIDMAWTRDGEDWMQDTFRGVLAPNSDGTYHAWLGIKIDPKGRGRYRCHVEHDSLLEALDLALEEPGASNLGLIVGCVVGAVLLVMAAGIAGILLYCRKRQDGYRAASISDGGSSSSSKA